MSLTAALSNGGLALTKSPPTASRAIKEGLGLYQTTAYADSEACVDRPSMQRQTYLFGVRRGRGGNDICRDAALGTRGG